MTIRKIYLDMDGVLADFDRGVRELCHRDPLPQGTGTREEKAALWAAIRKVPHFYGKLEPMDGAVLFFSLLEDEYGDRVEILTGIPKPYKGVLYSAEDKTAWVRRYLSEKVVINIVYREEKPEYCTGPEDILVDDYAKNIREWENSGGTGILYRGPEETLRSIAAILPPFGIR